jgi:hypothetical protein
VGEPSFFSSLKAYVGFSEGSTSVLQAAYAHVAPHVAAIIDDFYATIDAHPGARKAITGGQAQISRPRTAEPSAWPPSASSPRASVTSCAIRWG